MPRWAPRGARKLFQDREASDTDGKAAKAGFTFSWPILGALALFLIGAVIWSFIMGFMVGQGHNPNSKIQEITGISLSSEPEKKIESEATIEEPSPPQPANVSATEEKNTPAPPKQEAAFRVPKGNELAAWGEAPQKASPPPKKEMAAKPVQEALFDFTFQIAAFKNKTDAENLQKKLAAINVKTKIQKSGAVQLLITQIRGNATVPEKLRQKLLSLKLGKPLQLSKKALSTSPKRNK